MTDDIFKQDAKTIVDMAFETKLFKDSVTRDDMNAFEEYLDFVIKSRFNSYLKMRALQERIDKLEK